MVRSIPGISVGMACEKIRVFPGRGPTRARSSGGKLFGMFPQSPQLEKDAARWLLEALNAYEVCLRKLEASNPLDELAATGLEDALGEVQTHKIHLGIAFTSPVIDFVLTHTVLYTAVLVLKSSGDWTNGLDRPELFEMQIDHQHSIAVLRRACKARLSARPPPSAFRPRA